MKNRLETALNKRLKILNNENNTCRLINGAGDDFSGLTLDKFNNHYQIQIFNNQAYHTIGFVSKYIIENLQPEFLVVKKRVSPAGASLQNPEMEVLYGDESKSKTIVKESKLEFNVDLLDTINPGLFLDMRDNRRRIMNLAKNKSVLNLFAYTCSFGLYVKAGGAKSIYNVDVSLKILNKGKDNFVQNNIDLADGCHFIREDCLQYLTACVKAKKSFDLIVLDPPSFSRNKKEVFSVQKDMEKLLELCIECLNVGGTIQASTNYSKFNNLILEKMLKDISTKQNCGFTSYKALNSSKDFPVKGKIKESSLSVILAQDKSI